MGISVFNLDPQTITIAVGGTGSFTPQKISKTPQVSFQIVKLSDKNSLNSLTLSTSNVVMEYQVVDGGVGNVKYPSGSQNEYLWYTEPAFTSANSGALAVAPFSTGSAPGSVVIHLPSLNSQWSRINLMSNSGGTFQLISVGKLGE